MKKTISYWLEYKDWFYSQGGIDNRPQRPSFDDFVNWLIEVKGIELSEDSK